MGFMKEFICFTQILYFFVVSGGILSIAIYLDEIYEDHTDQYKNILFSWRLEPILELRSTQRQCQENVYKLSDIKEITFTQYIWPGTKVGCDCTHLEANGRYPQVVYPNICNTTNLAFKCEIVMSQDQAKFQSFPSQQGSSYRICGNRSQGHSFYLAENTCQVGERLCGETADNQYCSINGVCPIYSLEITKSQQLNYSNEYLQLSQEDYLIIHRISDAYLPLNQLKVSEMNGPCMDKNQLSITPGRVDYVLMNIDKKDCELDLNYRLIQAINEVDYYKANDFNYIANELPEYVIDSQYQWGIFQSGYIEWKLECRGDILQKFKGYEVFLCSIEEEKQILLYICALQVAFVCVVMLSSCCSDNFICCCRKYRKKIHVILQLSIKISASITIFYFIIPAYFTLNDIIPEIQTIIDSKCSDQHTISGLNNLLFHLQFYLHYYYEIIIYIISFTTIFEIFILLYQFIHYWCCCVITCFGPAKRQIDEIPRVIAPIMPIRAQIRVQEVENIIEKKKEDFDYQEASIPGEDNQDHQIYQFEVEQNNNELFENKAE